MRPLGSASLATGAEPSVAAAGTRWLLDGPAQLREGPHAGAIVGAVDGDQRAQYAYPEITGYFLQWLAWRARRWGASPALVQRAKAAQTWLKSWLCVDPPLTRIHLQESAVADWRNGAVFFFDVAMVLRGLGSAAGQGLLTPDPHVVAGLARQLERMIAADGLFVACSAHSGTFTPLPHRWSTRRGGFLAKAAAGIMTAAPALPGVPPDIVTAAAATYIASLRWDAENPHSDVHPLLYTFEGIMSMPAHPRFHDLLPVVAARYGALLAQVGSRGQLPESIAAEAPASGPARIDIMAQALRIGQLLGAHRPQRPPDRAALARLRQGLARQFAPSGAIPFALDQKAPQWNVWAAMFVDQALGFAYPRHAQDSLTTDPLLV